MGTSSYNVYKEVSTNIYNWIGNVLFSSPSEFIDASSTPEIIANRYKISSVDTCLNESSKSPYHQNIHLSVSQGIPVSNIELQWNHYIDESGAFVPDYYYIYRGNSPASLTQYFQEPLPHIQILMYLILTTIV